MIYNFPVSSLVGESKNCRRRSSPTSRATQKQGRSRLAIRKMAVFWNKTTSAKKSGQVKNYMLK